MYLNRRRRKRLEEQNETPDHIIKTRRMTNTYIHDLELFSVAQTTLMTVINHVLKHVIYYISILELVIKSENQILHHTNFTKELHLIIKHQTFLKQN